VLIFVLVAALFGVLLVHFFDPLSIVTRVLTLLFYPVALFLTNNLLDIARPIAEYSGWFGIARLSFLQPVYYMGIPTLLFFGGILALGRIHSRFWCCNVCPLGALLGFIGRCSVVKRTVTEACIDCGKCQRRCPTAAIAQDPRETLSQECIQCRACKRLCPSSAIHFPWRFPFIRQASTVARQSPATVSRRSFLASVGAGVTTSFFIGIHPSKQLLHAGLIRPPGAVPEDLFLDRCVRCGECMKACTTNTLQPAFLESGPEGLWTPKLVMRYAPCEQRCNVCGQVCPTDAIRALDLEERKHAKMGTAVLYRDRCLVWQQDKLCLICDEQCPYDAIEFRIIEGVRRPFVLEDRCNGCGVCEHKCPVQGQAAIVVTPIAALRLAEGSYIKESKRLGYEFSDVRPETEQFLLDESIFQPQSQSQQLPPGFSAEKGSQLPPGFTE
jgi:MauM/NapG family ferredoxin protein